jgi:hypothetical protein
MHKHHAVNPAASLAATAALLLPCLSGCGGGGGNGNADPLVGRWRAVSIALGEQTSGCPGGLGDVSCGSSDTVRFNADKTFVADLGNPAGDRFGGRGTWSRSSENTLRVTVTRASFDENRNGASDAGETFRPRREPPQVLNYRIESLTASSLTLSDTDVGGRTNFSKL